MSTLTIFAISSWQPTTHRAAWAAVIERDSTAIIRCGSHVRVCANSQQGEFAALAAALSRAALDGMMNPQPVEIELCSDCMEVLSTIRWALGAASVGSVHVPVARNPGPLMREARGLEVLRVMLKLIPMTRVSVRYTKTESRTVRRALREAARAEREALEHIA